MSGRGTARSQNAYRGERVISARKRRSENRGRGGELGGHGGLVAQRDIEVGRVSVDPSSSQS